MKATTCPIILLVSGLFGATALAQFSRVTWEASLNDGQTWQGGTVEVTDPNARVRVRAMVDWVYPGAYAFARYIMDVTVTGLENAGPADQALDSARIHPFQLPVAQTLAAMRFGNIIKIDDERDTLGPGIGTRGVDCGQFIEIAGQPFSREHPAPIMAFILALDGTEGTRVVSHSPLITAGGSPIRPALYLTPEGAQAVPEIVHLRALNLVVIPAPASLGLLLPLLALPRQRCR